MGQIYILEPVRYVYPFNTGIILNKKMTIVTDGGDLSYNDRILLSIDGNCSEINMGNN